MSRRVIPVMLLLLACGAAVWIWFLHSGSRSGWQGYVDADYLRIGPTQPGQLMSVAVARGDQVDAGALLFVQDSENERAARDQAAARLEEAAARLADLRSASRTTEIAQAEARLAELRAIEERAAHDLQRAEKLARDGNVSRQRLDRARAEARSARAQVEAAAANLKQMQESTGRVQEIAAQRAVVEQAKAALMQAEWRLSQRRVSAPTASRVNEVYARPGETMDAGQPVVSLLAPENILVRFFVPEPDLARIHLGDQVQIGCDNCPPGLRARISFVSPQAEYTPPVIYSEETRSKLVYLIEARPIDRPGRLSPGQPVSVEFAQNRSAR